MRKQNMFTTLSSLLRTTAMICFYAALVFISGSSSVSAQEEPGVPTIGSCAVGDAECLVPESGLPENIGRTGVCEAGDLPGLDVVDENDESQCDCEGPDGISGENCDIIRVLEIGTNVLAGAAAVAVVGGIMYGGYLYMTARDNPGQVQAAKVRIAWALAALLILIFFWGFLQWLIPGGVLGGGIGG